MCVQHACCNPFNHAVLYRHPALSSPALKPTVALAINDLVLYWHFTKFKVGVRIIHCPTQSMLQCQALVEWVSGSHPASHYAFGTAGHWQNKNYPYPPYQGLTLGDGILRNLDMENKYWWVWLGIGVNLAYILLMNMIIIICLAYLPGES